MKEPDDMEMSPAIPNTLSIQIQPAFTCSKLIIKTLEQGVKYVRRRSGVFIVNFKHISHLVLVFLLLTMSR